MSLIDLPGDIIPLIIGLLDPVGLISASQTCRQLRKIIAPRKRHFAQRLLVIECSPEYNSQASTDTFLDFATHTDGNGDNIAERSRWACTDCLLLLPHIKFDNRSLSRVAYAKPALLSIQEAYTTWEATERQEARFYKATLHKQVGGKRAMRRCIECKFQRGLLRPRFARRDLWHGHNRSIWGPVVTSRQVEFPSHVERWFPGFWERLDSQRPSFDLPLFRIYREGPCTSAPWTMYMVRCSFCTKWQEIRAFRVNGLFPHWSPRADYYNGGSLEYVDGVRTTCTSEMYNSLKCNHCFAKAHGRRALNAVLLKILRVHFHWQRHLVFAKLQTGWCILSQSLFQMPRMYKAWKSTMKAWQRETNALFPDETPMEDDGFRLTAPNLAFLRFRFTQWQDLWQEMNDCGAAGEV